MRLRIRFFIIFFTLIRNQFKIVVSLWFCVVFYVEYVVYYLQPFGWPDLECPQESEECVRVLLVADPQILGEQNEERSFKSLMTWDCDNYIKKTYDRAVAHFKPNVIIFLGDIMNEGIIASDEEFRSYTDRISHIFATSYPIKHIWIPGDNDIGGENKPINADKVKMFNDAFNQPNVVTVDFMDIYKINSITQSLPKLPSNHVIMTNKTNIIATHIPLLLTPGRFTGRVLTNFQPVIVFSGHKHAAFRLETTLDTMFVSKVIAITPQDKNNIINIQYMQDTYHEFVVPTCSYRMGVPNMGYGIAVIGKSELSYSILWSPRRYEQLIFYIFVLLLAVLYLATITIFKLMGIICNNIKYSKV